MSLDTHTAPAFSDMVKALAKPGAAIIADLTPETAHILHMGCIGVCGELTELVVAIRNGLYLSFQKESGDWYDNVIEEVGDLLFYIQGLEHAHDQDSQDVAITFVTNPCVITWTDVDFTLSGRANVIIDALLGYSEQYMNLCKRVSVYAKSSDSFPTSIISINSSLIDTLSEVVGLFAINPETVISGNIQKLWGKRYASGKYSNEAAIDRVDKVE